MQKAIILFESPNVAMWAENILKDQKIKCRIIPVPREFSSDCGYCLKIDFSDKVKIERIFSEENIDFSEIIKV